MRTVAACLAWCVLGLTLLTVVSCGKSNGLLPPADDAGLLTLPPAASCQGAPVVATEAKSVDSISDDVDTTCAAVVGFLDWKGGATGSACTGPLDCTPVCCPCPNGTHHTLATWCHLGHCAAPADVACMISGTPGLVSCSQ